MEIMIVAMLLLFGLGMLLIEVVFIPGITWAGLLALLSTVAGIYLGYDYFGETAGTLILGADILLSAGLIYTSLKSKFWERFALKSTMEGKVQDENALYLTVNIGEQGIAKSALRPFGRGEFGGESMEVYSQDGFVDAGKAIRVIKIEGRKIFVREIKLFENPEKE
jgi:membrane-bound ClpP family serine protease